MAGYVAVWAEPTIRLAIAITTEVLMTAWWLTDCYVMC